MRGNSTRLSFVRLPHKPSSGPLPSKFSSIERKSAQMYLHCFDVSLKQIIQAVKRDGVIQWTAFYVLRLKLLNVRQKTSQGLLKAPVEYKIRRLHEVSRCWFRGEIHLAQRIFTRLQTKCKKIIRTSRKKRKWEPGTAEGNVNLVLRSLLSLSPMLM